MPFGRKTYTFAVLVVLLALRAGGAAAQVPDGMQSPLDTQEVHSLLGAAQEVKDRRNLLESALRKHDQRIEKAKTDLQNATERKKTIEGELAHTQQLKDALALEMRTVEQSQQFYEGLLHRQGIEFATFLRYAARKHMEVHDTGPAVGGGLLRMLLRGSLSESIDNDLYLSGIAKIRQSYITAAEHFLAETGDVVNRLTTVAIQVDVQLTELQKEQEKMLSTIETKSMVVDESWKQRTLTETDLKQVQDEYNEASSKVASMRGSLTRIHLQLKEIKLRELHEIAGSIRQKMTDVDRQKQLLVSRDKAMVILQDDALKAWNKALALKNSDKKLYKKLEEAEFELKRLSNPPPWDGSLSTEKAKQPVGSPSEIRFVQEKIGLLKQGIPAESAEAYLRAKHRGEIATDERKKIAADVIKLAAQYAKFQKDLSDTVSKIDAVNAESDALIKQAFVWPIKGRITAGYHDTAYLKVFHVPHRAIDIAAPYGTPVYTIAEGIVYSVRLGGAKGYTYVLIGHRDGYASLYGHLSQVRVTVGQLVKFNQVIGSSGGTPGTPGAGPMTTGPHLHLEVIKDGAHVDPRTVLPK